MIGIVLICYKNVEECKYYIEQELSKVKSDKRIIIVDNSQNDVSYKNMVKDFNAVDATHLDSVEKNRELFCINSGENLGYAKANNMGFEFLKAQFPEIENYLFSNTDILLDDGDVVDKLSLKLNSLPEEFGAINPSILDTRGEILSPRIKVSFFRMCVWPKLFFPIIHFFFRNKDYRDIGIKGDEGQCYRIDGCFFMAKKKAFEKCNGFDPYTFLYAEELILAERMLSVGYKNYYSPEKQITHLVNQTTGKHFTSNRLDKMVYKSRRYYFKTYRKTSFLMLLLGDVAQVFNQLFNKPILQLVHNLKGKR